MTMLNIKGKEFYLDSFLIQKLDTLKNIVFKKNWDGVILVDGLERVGKSTLGITCAYYLADGNFTVNNICANNDDVIKKIESFPDKSILLVDEGSLVFNSRDSMKKEQKKLIKILNVVGQKNMIFIIILPSFFDLNKQIALRRSKFLLHCYTDNTLHRGRFAYFGEDAKKILYTKGKKNFDSYQYPKRSRNELGRFTSFNPLGDEYLETKKRSLSAALHEDEVSTKQKVSYDIFMKVVRALEAYDFKERINRVKRAKMLGMATGTYNKYIKMIRNEQVLANQVTQNPLINNPLEKDENVITDKEYLNDEGEQDEANKA